MSHTPHDIVQLCTTRIAQTELGTRNFLSGNNATIASRRFFRDTLSTHAVQILFSESPRRTPPRNLARVTHTLEF
jgi:hypothetical protein